MRGGRVAFEPEPEPMEGPGRAFGIKESVVTGWVPAARVSEDSWSSDDGYEEGSGEWSEEEDQDNTPLFLAGMQGADTSPATASQASTEQT